MDRPALLAEHFEAQRARLLAVAYRLLGSLGDAEDAVQETWLRLDRTDTRDVTNLAGWLTTVVSRVCLDKLRARTARGEVPLEARLPEPVVGDGQPGDPEHEALLAESVALALLVVLETLEPAERIAFILHDTFAVPFHEVAAVVGRSPAATRQLASRARRRVRAAAIEPDPEPGLQRQLVGAFLAAARRGDLAALVALLDPDVVVRADDGRPPVRVLRGSAAVAEQAVFFSRASANARVALVGGSAGIVAGAEGRPTIVMAFAVRGGRIAEIHILRDLLRRPHPIDNR